MRLTGVDKCEALGGGVGEEGVNQCVDCFIVLLVLKLLMWYFVQHDNK